MSWLGLRHKGVEVLYPQEWNTVVDGLDILKRYADSSVKYDDLPRLPSDVAPSEDNVFDLGLPNRRWRDVRAYYGYFDTAVYIQGKPALKDGDPVITKEFIDAAKQDIEQLKAKLDELYGFLVSFKDEVKSELSVIELYTRPPSRLSTLALKVGLTPVPLSKVEGIVKRIHIKVPSWAMYLVYIGDEKEQSFVLEPGDKEVFEVANPRNVYVRSLGEATIYIALEE